MGHGQERHAKGKQAALRHREGCYQHCQRQQLRMPGDGGKGRAQIIQRE